MLAMTFIGTRARATQQALEAESELADEEAVAEVRQQAHAFQPLHEAGLAVHLEHCRTSLRTAWPELISVPFIPGN